jgi:SAM-dependent methyltransferase
MSMVKQAVRIQYEGRAGREYHARVHGSSPQTADTVARERARKLQPLVRPGDAVFEYGVGTGLNLRHLRCRRRIGFDISDAGRAECVSAGIEFVTSLDEVPADMSVAICHHVLEHVPDPLECLEQMYGRLRAGGRLILCVPFETHRSYRHYVPGDQNHHLFSWNALSLGNLVTVAGFSVTRVRVHPFGYERRLSVLSEVAGDRAYRLGLALARALRPANELLLEAAKP